MREAGDKTLQEEEGKPTHPSVEAVVAKDGCFTHG
jgi:hypothetical protein